MSKYDDIMIEFQRLANADKAKQMSAYMRGLFQFYGIPTPERRAVYRQFLRLEKRSEWIDWELLHKCWADDHREFQYFALDFLEAKSKHLKYDDITQLERYVRSRQWWDTIDALDGIIGRIGHSDPRVGSLMLTWSSDPDFWVRRVAIDHQLYYKEYTDTQLLEKILVNNFGSREFFINKAIGWSLREYSKTNPQWVSDFIERYRSEMSPLSIREASKYL